MRDVNGFTDTAFQNFWRSEAACNYRETEMHELQYDCTDVALQISGLDQI